MTDLRAGSALRRAWSPVGVMLPIPEPKYATREQWLSAARDWLALHFAKRGHALGKVRVSHGFPVGGQNVLGECWADSVSRDATREIFTTPACDNAEDLLFILTHELCHAALPHGVHHGPKWADLAESFHMIHGPGGTYIGNNTEFKAFIAPLVAFLGVFPHAAMNVGRRSGGFDGWPGLGGGGKCGGFRVKPKATQGTRMVKCQCAECGYVARTTRKWLDAAGAPICPTHKSGMSEEGR